MFIAALFTIVKTWNQPKCPWMIDWTRKIWHIYTMEYYAPIKIDEFMSFVGRDVDESGNCHSQLTETRKENQTLHVLTHSWVLNNENTWTQGGEHHTLGSVGEKWGGTAGGRELGEIAWGEMPDIGAWEEGSKSHCHVCNYATILHVLHMYPQT